MNSHDLTVTGYLVFIGPAVGLQIRSAHPRSRIPSFDALLRAAMRTRAGRVGIVVGWAWVGLHFFAR
jgi:hypothetical protein